MHPFLNLFGIKIPSYGLLMLTGVLIATYIIIKKSSKSGIAPDNIIALAASAVVGFIIGGSLLYTVVTFPAQYIIESAKRLDFRFLRSGLVFYGGLAGGLVGAYLGSKTVNTPLYLIEDAAVPTVPLCHALGRIGCSLAGCCYGFKYEGIFAIKNLLADPSGGLGFFPVQLVEAAALVFISIMLWQMAKRPHRKYELLFSYLLLYACVRFFTEFLRGDAIRGIYHCLSTSQWISLFVVLIYIIRKWRLRNKSY